MDRARKLAMEEAWKALREAIAVQRKEMLNSTQVVNALEEKRLELMQEAFEDEEGMVTQDQITYAILLDQPSLLSDIRNSKLSLITAEGKLEQARLDWEYQTIVARLETEAERE